MNLKASKRTALAITGGGEEEEAPALKKKAPSRKEQERAWLRCQDISLISPNPKAKRKSTSSYRTKSQPEISLTEGGGKKEKIGLQSLVESKRMKVNSPESFFGLRFF